MNNGNQSAYPITKFVSDPAGIGEGLLSEMGLTKREYLAAVAMQGLFAGMGTQQEYAFADVAENAVEAADQLLLELEKTK